MSAIGGIYNFDEAPIDMQMFANLSVALDSRGPDGGREIQNGSLGMIYRAFHTNKESRMEKQPLVSRYGHILTWDGRVDNREELLREFSDGLEGDKTDVALVMAAYLKWGGEFLQKVIGDFALSLWVPQEKKVILARDPIGTRPLYYKFENKQLLWSSELKSILNAINFNTEIDDDYIAGYLTNTLTCQQTPYKNIFSIDPGDIYVFQNGRQYNKRFWVPDPDNKINYSSDSEYEEHFLELFRESVKARIRTETPVWAELSGGWDSSSIVCVADQLIKNNDVSCPKLETLSYLYKSSPTANETHYISAVEQHIGKQGIHLDLDNWLLEYDQPNNSIVRPNPYSCIFRRYEWIHKNMEQEGARILLSGLCGDNVLWSQIDVPPELGDLFAQGRFFKLHNQIVAWAEAEKTPYLKTLWNAAIRPNLPLRFNSYLTNQLTILELLDDKFIHDYNIKERAGIKTSQYKRYLPSDQLQLGFLDYAISVVSHCRHRDFMPVDYVYPYLHLPLVDFLLRVPITQKLRPGEMRSLHKRGMKQVLPETILNRKSKQGPDESICRAFINKSHIINQLLQTPIICSKEYIQPIALQNAIIKCTHGAQRYAGDLLSVLNIELWLKSVDQLVTQTNEIHEAASSL